MLGKMGLIFGIIFVIMAVLPGGCKTGNPTSEIMPVLSTNKEPADNGYGVFIGFRHTQPGVYSEVSVTVYGQADDKVRMTLSGPAVSPPATQEARVENDGSITFTWKITKFGTYTASGSYDPASINVQAIKASVVVK